MREADEPRIGDIIIAPGDLDFAAQDAAEAGPIHEDDGQNHLIGAHTQPDDQQQGQNDGGEGEPDFHHPRDAPIDPAAEIAREARQNGAEDHRAEGGEQGDGHGGARAIDQPREQIPPKAVGPPRRCAAVPSLCHAGGIRMDNRSCALGS